MQNNELEDEVIQEEAENFLDEYDEAEESDIAHDETQHPKEPEPALTAVASKSEAEELQALVDIINKYFQITKVKLTPDDPTVGMLLAQRIDLDGQISRLDKRLMELHEVIDSQVDKHNNRLKDVFDEAIKDTEGRMTEVDIRFQSAIELSNELKNQRERLLSELSVHHQKNILQFAQEINESVKNSTKYALFSLITGTASVLMMFFLLIVFLLR